MSSISKKILAIYLLVLVLGVTLSTLIYLNGRSVTAATSALVEVNLPRLNDISKLRVAIIAQKPVLFEYYATTDRTVFLKEFEANQRTIEAGLRTIRSNDEGQALLTQIESQVEQINRLAGQLDRIFTTPPLIGTKRENS